MTTRLADATNGQTVYGCCGNGEKRMIMVTWFCTRCGRKVRAKKFYNVQPMDAIDANDEMCNDCMKEYEALRKKQKTELDEFWKERTHGTAK